MKTIIHNGVPCIEARVHMLAADGVGALSTRKSSGVITAYIKDLGNIYQPQHLYITTDEEIKKGDYIYDGLDKVGKTTKNSDFTWMNKVNTIRKIIATTDPKIYFNDIGEGVIESYGKLPQIPQSFIEEYCKAGGIDRVMVECIDEWFLTNGKPIPDVMRESMERNLRKNSLAKWNIVYTPKTDSNNCIIIHPVEENIYNVNRQVFLKLVHDVGDSLSQKDSIGFNLDKWIKENL
jgi:hypothetical protein